MIVAGQDGPGDGTDSRDTTTMQRIACALIGAALFVVCCLVALLLGDALAPGRLPPMPAFYAACGAGASLILGLAMLERRGAPHGLAAFEGR
jgi:hypothetical protein